MNDKQEQAPERIYLVRGSVSGRFVNFFKTKPVYPTEEYVHIDEYNRLLDELDRLNEHLSDSRFSLVL